MSSGNVYETLFKQWASVGKFLVDGKRDPKEVSDVLQAIIDGKKLVEAKPTSSKKLLADWIKFYKEVFGLELDFSGIKIPDSKPGFDRLLVVAQGMTPQRLFDKCKELFPSWKYTDKSLDEVIKSDRTGENGHYAIWARDRVEADEENKNRSADFLRQRETPEITLEERELYELKFFKETGEHLDMKNWTLCAGSRNSDGDVPSAFWDDGRFRVSWNYASNHYDDLRSRSVVS
ncbi:MAG: hypothetical protein HYT36_01205 [Candidatus Staskawiczbacteria bacterium]|nr:hypothetical protein [Candidatus Staskawiczbacteria bacterium]